MHAEHRRPLVAFAAVTCACALAIGNAAGVALTSADSGAGHEPVVASRSPRAGDSSLAQQAIHGVAPERITPAKAPVYSPVYAPADTPAVPVSESSAGGPRPPVSSTTSGNHPFAGSDGEPPSPSGLPSTPPPVVPSSPNPTPEPTPSSPPSSDVPESDDGVLTIDDLIHPTDPPAPSDTSPHVPGNDRMANDPEAPAAAEQGSVNAVVEVESESTVDAPAEVTAP